MVGVTFLRWAWEWDPSLYGEIRGLGAGLAPIQLFVPLSYSDEAIDVAIEEAGAVDRDVYFGVVPRVRMSGTAENVAASTRIIWADVDAKMHDHSKTKALTALLTADPVPQAIVDSGGGYHAYWRLSVKIGPWYAVQVMKGIAAKVGGDHTYDMPRILRVPGTPNHKYAGWPEARLLRFDQKRFYSPADFEQYMSSKREVPIVGSGVTWIDRNPHQRKDLDPWLVELINSAPPKGSRSEAAFKAGLWLWRYGYTPEEIEQIFETAPIGEKYREEGNGHRWFSRMLSKFS